MEDKRAALSAISRNFDQVSCDISVTLLKVIRLYQPLHEELSAEFE